jgi:hypothetical protein
MPEEDGVFDADVQPVILGESESDNSNTTWLNDDENSRVEPNAKTENLLEDTQQIPVNHEDENELLTNSSKALEGGNTQYALTTLKKLIHEKKNLSEVARQLERAVELYPERSDFHLLLGETYVNLDEKEKALLTLQNAQKFISL